MNRAQGNADAIIFTDVEVFSLIRSVVSGAVGCRREQISATHALRSHLRIDDEALARIRTHLNDAFSAVGVCLSIDDVASAELVVDLFRVVWTAVPSTCKRASTADQSVDE